MSDRIQPLKAIRAKIKPEPAREPPPPPPKRYAPPRATTAKLSLRLWMSGPGPTRREPPKQAQPLGDQLTADSVVLELAELRRRRWAPPAGPSAEPMMGPGRTPGTCG
jgi:hypothetical protein